MNTSTSTNDSVTFTSKFVRPLVSSLLALGCVLSSGCFVAIGESEFVDEEYPERPRCEQLRHNCLVRAGSDSKFQETCHDSYRTCIAGSEGAAKPNGSSPGAWDPEEDAGEKAPSKPNDPAWNQRCETLEDGCFASAGTIDDKEACGELGVDCVATFCGEKQLCSTYQCSPDLLSCWGGFQTCNDKARDEDEIASCGTVFRLCGQSVSGFEALAEQDDEDVLDCLTQSLLCQRVAKGQPDLEKSCRTMLSSCLLN